MKRLTLILMYVLLITCMVGCSNTAKPDNGNNVSQEQVSLRYMIWDKNQEAAYREIIGKFMEQNPNITVDIQVVPWGSYWEKLMTDIAGGSAPDVFWGYLSQLPSLVKRDALLPITNYVKRDKPDVTSMNSSLAAAFEYKGERYGIPKDWDTPGVFYNKKLLNQAGFESFPKDLKWNPKDGGTLVPFLQKLTLDQNGKHPNEEGFDSEHIKQYGLNYSDRGDWDPSDLLGFVASNGGQFLKAGQFVPEDKFMQTMSFLHDLVFKYHVSPAYTVVRTAGSDQMFFSSQTALWITGSWEMIPISDKARFAWGIQPFPTGPDNKRVVRINGTADHIYSQTQHPEEAWKLVRFISSKAAQDILAETGTVMPMNKKSIPKFVDYYKGIGIDTSIFVEEQAGETVTPPVVNNYPQWLDVWYTNMALIFSGEMDLNTGIEKIVTEGNPIIAKPD